MAINTKVKSQQKFRTLNSILGIYAKSSEHPNHTVGNKQK